MDIKDQTFRNQEIKLLNGQVYLNCGFEGCHIFPRHLEDHVAFYNCIFESCDLDAGKEVMSALPNSNTFSGLWKKVLTFWKKLVR